MRLHRSISILLAGCLAGCLAGNLTVSGDGSAPVPSCMPTTLSPASPPTFPATLSGPSDTAACNAASVNTPFTDALSGIEAARLMLYNGLSKKPYLRCLDGETVVMAGVPAMAVTVSGVWTVKGPIAAQSFVVADLEGGGAFVDDTFYYMYLKLVAGTVTRVISTTAPDVYNAYRASNTDQAYVGSFLYHGTPNEIASFSAVNGEYTYHSVYPFTTLAAGTGPTAINLATLKMVPPSARDAILSMRGTFGTSATVDVQFQFRPTDGTTSNGYAVSTLISHRMYNGSGAAQDVLDTGGRFRVNMSGSQQIDWIASSSDFSSSVGGSAILRAEGYVEP